MLKKLYENLISTTLDDRFLILSVLGEGGLGVVLKAEQSELNRLVAIKILHANELEDSNQSLARFQQEAKILAAFEHPNIVQVYSFGLIEDKKPYMAMEYIEGKTLSLLLAEAGKLPWEQVVDIICQVCQAASYAHEHGVIHRDLKPQNIMLSDKPEKNSVKVLDFGLSKILYPSVDEQKLTQTGALLGTVHYMAPEICLGKRASEQSDIYSLGCILYECISGRVPLNAEHPLVIMHKHVHELPKPLLEPVPAELELAIFKAIQKIPENRFKTMSEFESVLRLIRSGRGNNLKLGKIEHAKSKEKNKTAQITFISLILVISIALSLHLAMKSIEQSCLPARTIKSRAQLNRIESQKKAALLAETAKNYLKSGRPERANDSAERALLTLAQTFPHDAISKEFALKDLGILENIEPVLAKTRKHKLQLHQIEFHLMENDHNALAFPDQDQGRLYIMLAKLRSDYGDFFGCMHDFLQAASSYSTIKKPEKVSQIIQVAAELRANNKEQEKMKSAYLALAEVYLAVCGTDRQAIEKSLHKAMQVLQNTGPCFGEYDYIELWVQLCQIEIELFDYQKALECCRYPWQAAKSIESHHEDKLFNLIELKLEIYLKSRNKKEAAAAIKEMKAFLDRHQDSKDFQRYSSQYQSWQLKLGSQTDHQL